MDIHLKHNTSKLIINITFHLYQILHKDDRNTIPGVNLRIESLDSHAPSAIVTALSPIFSGGSSFILQFTLDINHLLHRIIEHYVLKSKAICNDILFSSESNWVEKKLLNLYMEVIFSVGIRILNKSCNCVSVKLCFNTNDRSVWK